MGEKIGAKQESKNPMDKCAMKVVKGNETVSQLPREFCRIAWHFLVRSEKISVELIGHIQHCKQQCRKMEISCQLEFSFSKKVQTLERTTPGLEPEDASKQPL